MTKLKTDMQRTVELVDRPKTPRKNLVKKRKPVVALVESRRAVEMLSGSELGKLGSCT